MYQIMLQYALYVVMNALSKHILTVSIKHVQNVFLLSVLYVVLIVAYFVVKKTQKLLFFLLICKFKVTDIFSLKTIFVLFKNIIFMHILLLFHILTHWIIHLASHVVNNLDHIMR